MNTPRNTGGSSTTKKATKARIIWPTTSMDPVAQKNKGIERGRPVTHLPTKDNHIRPRQHAPPRGSVREVRIPKDFYECIPSEFQNFKVSFLEFNHEKGGFTEECTSEDGSATPKQDSKIRELHFRDKCPKNYSAFIPFTGNTESSRIKVLLNGLETSATADTGCESSVMASSLADNLVPNWKGLVRPDGQTFEGPNGESLENLGKLDIEIWIAGRNRTLGVNIIEGKADSLLLGTPALKDLGALIKAGEGIYFCNNSMKIAQIRANDPLTSQDRAVATEKAEQIQHTLPPLTFPVTLDDTQVIPPFEKKYLIFRPDTLINTSCHNFQKFTFRPCHCVLKGNECTTCVTNGLSSPYQLVTLENNTIRALFINTNATPWVVTPSQDFSMEFHTHTYSCKELAEALLEEIEAEPLTSPYTRQETKRLFDLSVEDFKSRLYNVICEPSGFDEGFREPILKIHPNPPPPRFNDRSISIKDYLTCNPCESCENAGQSICDATIDGCVTTALYEPGLPEKFYSNQITHSQHCDISRQVNASTALVICSRGGMTTLHELLQEIHPGYTTAQQEYTDATGKNTILFQSCLPNHQTVHASTEYLKETAKRCRILNITCLHFPNFEDFGISKRRLQRIFDDKCFTLNLYERNHLLFRIWPSSSKRDKKDAKGCPGGHDQNDFPTNGTKGRPSGQGKEGIPGFPAKTTSTVPTTMPAKPKPLLIEPGLPKSITSEEVKEKKKYGEATILCTSEDIKKKTIQLMDSHQQLWSKSEWHIGTFKDKKTGKPVYFQLKLKSFEPVLQSPRFVSQGRQEPARALIGGLLENGVITPCYTRYAQNSVFVKKKTQRISPEEWVKLGYKIEDYAPNTPHPQAGKDTYRHTLDWSDLNKNLATLPIAAADPRAIFNSIQDNSLISIMDLACAYHAILLAPSSRQYTGFHTGLRDIGQMTYKRLVMGCSQAATFLQTAVQSALQECSEWAHCLWDDIVILAPNEETMLQRLAIVFTNLESSGFIMKRHKVALFIGAQHPDVQLFGMNINLRTKVLSPLADKVKEILERPTPRTQTEMKSLLGAINWQSSFLHGSAPHHAVLHRMTHKNCQFIFTEERLQALEFFIDALTSPTCFNHLPSPSLDFDIHADACDYSGGMVLSQKESSGRVRIISYQSRVFSERQIRMSTFEKESLTALMAIESFWCFIEGKRTTLYTDSKNSAYITIFSKTNSKVGRYRLFLESLDFLRIVWVPAETPGLKMADMLSRRSLHPKQCLNKQVKPEDTARVDLVAQKLRNKFHYTISQAHYLLDYILELSEDDIKQIPDNSLYMNAKGEICTDKENSLTNLNKIGEQEIAHEAQKKAAELSAKAEETTKHHQEQDNSDAVNDKQMEHIHNNIDTTPNIKTHQSHPEEELPSSSKGCPSGHFGVERHVILETDNHNSTEEAPSNPKGCPSGLSKFENDEPKTHNTNSHCKAITRGQTARDLALNRKTTKSIGDIARNETPNPHPSFGEAVAHALDKDSLDETIFQTIHFPEDERLQPPPDSAPPPNAPREEKFLHCIQHSSPFLSFQSLREAQNKDQIFAPIIEKCERNENGLYPQNNRINYFVAGKFGVLCREVADERMYTCRLQLCIPRAHAFDFCLMAHRGTAGSALTSGGPPTHYNPRKLCRLLSQKLYIHKLSDILEHISLSCQICVEAKPHKRNRKNYIKKTIKVTRAAQVWFVDYLTVSSQDNVWGYRDLLIFTCGYSGYTVAAPVIKPTTQAYFIELLHTHVFQYFGKCAAIYSDNASNLSGKLVRDTATALNIAHNTTNKFMPRASGAELSNRHLLAGLRIQKEAFTMPPKQWCYLLSNALININFTPYQHSNTFTSPAIRFFGNASLAQNPQFYGHYITELTEQYETEDDLLRGVKKADDILATLRQQHNAQRWQEEPGQAEPVFEPGDIVMARYRPRPGREFAHKLTRRYKFKFSVVYSRGTTCWVRPYSQNSIEKWAAAVDMAKRSRESNLILPTYKVDATDLVRISHGIHLYNTNQRKMHYSEFAMEKPKELEIEVLQPVQAAPNLFAPERHRDTYSEYTDPKNSFGPNYDGEDEEEEEQNYCEMDMEEQLLGTKQNVYYYDSNDELRLRGGREKKSRGPKTKVNTLSRSSSPDTTEGAAAAIKADDNKAKASPVSILKKNTLSLGERLARLAGYSLESTTTKEDSPKTTHNVKFDKKVTRLDWRGIIEEALKEDNNRPIRFINQARPLNHPMAANINYLDAQLLPKDIWSTRDLLGCRCAPCNKLENAQCGNTAMGNTCRECDYHPAIFWD